MGKLQLGRISKPEPIVARAFELSYAIGGVTTPLLDSGSNKLRLSQWAAKVASRLGQRADTRLTLTFGRWLDSERRKQPNDPRRCDQPYGVDHPAIAGSEKTLYGQIAPPPAEAQISLARVKPDALPLGMRLAAPSSGTQ